MNDYLYRHLGPTEIDQQTMLDFLGCSMSELLDQTLPDDIRLKNSPPFPPALSEPALKEQLRSWGQQNKLWRSFIGQGFYPTCMPAVIRRNLLENPGWYSSYTPYQAEISQGRLEGLLIFQEMVCELTAMPLANASLLDEASAAAEALQLAIKVDDKKRRAFLVDARCHLQTLSVIKTRARSLGVTLVTEAICAETDFAPYCGVLLQTPDTEGRLHDPSDWIEKAHQQDTLVVIATDLLALTLITPPGEQGADIVLGSAQRLGMPMEFGGPHAAFFAVKTRLRRLLPGRLIGVSRDSYRRVALRMALQTREQHIRREKATSNICTAQSLLANISAFFAVYHGPDGLRRIAENIHRQAVQLAQGLQRHGVKLEHRHYFDTLTLNMGQHTEDVLARAKMAHIDLRTLSHERIALSLDQCTDKRDLEKLQQLILGFQVPLAAYDERHRGDDCQDAVIPESLRRTSSFMQQPVFNRYHSETELMRYLKRLERRDYSLAQGMIPLGSCTMKLNAVQALEHLSEHQWCDLHPYQPSDQVEGYRALISELEQMLCALTGFDQLSLQPNAGAQGEYAGLLAIKGYFEHRGESRRRYCLIPASAHGTNPASAVQAGFEVLPLALDRFGSPDLADLARLVSETGDEIACLMLTYPSTHGVFEPTVRELIRVVHQCGAQVYLDGANFNAMLGLTDFAKLGADVGHINLHKTFAIPHGGGGPGVGPIGVKMHLAPYLPADPATGACGAVAATRFGSAGVLMISWCYLRLMGYQGLKKASEIAILTANYIARRLEGAYSLLFKGKKGRVAHECILDIRPLTESSGVSAEDIAKRLIDYGFHAPTLSFPVPGTLMIEPTESESLREIDRFCAAMLAIRSEIEQVIKQKWPKTDNPLVNAPHPAACLIEEWHHPYSREVAVYPLESLKQDKFWPEVGRVDQVWGDRHLECSTRLLQHGDE